MSENVNSPNQQPDVIANYASEIQQIQMEGYAATVRKARNALFWAGGLIFFWEMIAMFREGGFEPIAFAIALFIGGIFVTLGLWTKTKPYTAVLTGLAVFIGYIALVVVINGLIDGTAGVIQALISGIIVKVIILVNLIRPIQDAKALQEARSQQF